MTEILISLEGQPNGPVCLCNWSPHFTQRSAPDGPVHLCGWSPHFTQRLVPNGPVRLRDWSSHFIRRTNVCTLKDKDTIRRR